MFVGSGLELQCKDKLSVPPATYRWYKDNRALTATADAPYIIDMKKGTLVRKYYILVKHPTPTHSPTLFVQSVVLPNLCLLSLFGTEIKQRVQI